MRINLADQHIQFTGAQLLLLCPDLIQQLFDIGKHLIIGIPDLVELCFRIQMDQLTEILSVKFCHGPVQFLNGLRKFIGKVNT